MDINNKYLVSRLLAAQDYITIVKKNLSKVDSTTTHVDTQIIGNNIVRMIQSRPILNQKLIDFLNKEYSVIEKTLKDL